MKYIRLAHLALALTPLTLSLAALPSPAPAQSAAGAANGGLPPGTPPLTNAQIQKQQARFNRFKQDVSALQANTSLSLPQKTQQFLTMRAVLDKDMLAILTPVQQKAVLKQRSVYLKQSKQMAALHNQFLKLHQADINQLKQLDQQLKNSVKPPQKQQMALIQQQAKEQAQKVIADAKTNDDVKQQTLQAIERDAVRQQMALMTPAQQTVFNQFQALNARLSQEEATFDKAHSQ